MHIHGHDEYTDYVTVHRIQYKKYRDRKSGLASDDKPENPMNDELSPRRRRSRIPYPAHGYPAHEGYGEFYNNDAALSDSQYVVNGMLCI